MLDIVSKISTRKENILMKRVDRYNISKPKKVYFILLITLNAYSFNTEYYVFFDVYLVLSHHESYQTKILSCTFTSGQPMCLFFIFLVCQQVYILFYFILFGRVGKDFNF